MLEEILQQTCHCSTTVTSLSGRLTTVLVVTQLIMEEMQQSCSWRKGTRCMCACRKIPLFGRPIMSPSMVFWSVKSESMTPEGWFQKPDINDASTVLPLKFWLKQMWLLLSHYCIQPENDIKNSQSNDVLTVSFTVSCHESDKYLNLMVHRGSVLSHWTLLELSSFTTLRSTCQLRYHINY